MLQLLICSKWGLMQFTQQIWSFLFCLFSYNTNWTLRLYLRIHLVKRFSQQRSSQRKFSQLVVSVIVTLTCCSKSPDSSVPNGAMISLLMSWRGNISLDWWITQTHHNSIIAIGDTCWCLDGLYWPLGWLSWQHAVQTPPRSWWSECILGREWERLINNTHQLYNFKISASVSYF